MSTVSEDTSAHIDLTDQQQMKFENIPANIGRGAQEGETRKAIPEVIHLLSDHDEVSFILFNFKMVFFFVPSLNIFFNFTVISLLFTNFFGGCCSKGCYDGAEYCKDGF